MTHGSNISYVATAGCGLTSATALTTNFPRFPETPLTRLGAIVRLAQWTVWQEACLIVLWPTRGD